MGEFPSGQRGQTVNLLSVTSVVRIHLPPPLSSRHLCLLDNFFVFQDLKAGSWRYAGDIPQPARLFRRKANPPSPTRNELMKVGSFFFCWMKRKISSSPRADSICSFSLFFARPSAPGRRVFFFCCGTLCRRTGIGGVRCGQTEEEAHRGTLTSTKNLLAKSRYHKKLAMSRIKLQVSCYN